MLVPFLFDENGKAKADSFKGLFCLSCFAYTALFLLTSLCALDSFTIVVNEIEAQLDTTNFLAGPNPSIADLFILPELDQLQALRLFSFETFPNISRFFFWLCFTYFT